MKERIDVLLVQKGLFPSREKAKAALMAGLVYVDKKNCDKAGTLIDSEAEIWIKDDICPYVGRGGLKLQKALSFFSLDLSHLICVDIGASTGGFTDCMLQNGARKVYSIDVGYGQLDYKLRNDPRVINMERINVRHMNPHRIPEQADFIAIDVSFISLNLIFPIASQLLKEGGSLICLIKPQFEAGREQVGKKGIVRDSSVHREVIQKVSFNGSEMGMLSKGLTYSPMTGAKGNIEYLMLMEKNKVDEGQLTEETIKTVIEEAHRVLGER
ncbi:MAG: TlyA family RNA methyltransferase [Anaerovoracaceae bacterium]